MIFYKVHKRKEYAGGNKKLAIFKTIDHFSTFGTKLWADRKID